MSSSVLKKLIQPHSQAVAAALSRSGLSAEEADMLETLSIVVEQCPVAIAMFDRNMQYLLANRQWVQEFNLGSAMPLIGKCQYEVFPKLHDGWKEIYERALKGYTVRCEHPVQAPSGGVATSVRFEVRPWRQKRDASVGGVVVMCHKFGGQPEPAGGVAADQNGEPRGLSEETEGEVKRAGIDFGTIPLPIYVVDGEGRIEEANEWALKQSLAHGLVMGETLFWRVLGGGGGEETLRSGFLEKIALLRSTPEAPPQVLTVKQGAAVASGEGGAQVALGPSRWLLTRLGEDAGLFALVGLTGLSPFEAVGSAWAAAPATPVPQVMPAAIQLAEAKNEGLVNEVKRLERELFMAREAVARLEQKVRTMRQAEQVLIRREKQQQSVLDALPGGVLVLNEHGKPILQNGHLQKLFGRPIGDNELVEDWLGQACPDPQHREDVQRVWRQDVWRRQLTRTLSLVTTDGLLKEIELRPASLAENGLVVHFQDVTQQCRIDEQLGATEGKFRTLFHDNPLAIVLTDKTGAIYDVNSAAELLLQSAKQELRRQSVEELLVTSSVGQRRDAIREMRQSGVTQQRMTVTLAGEAGPKMHLTLVAIKMADGEIHSFLHFFEAPVVWPMGEKVGDGSPSGHETADEKGGERGHGELVETPTEAKVAERAEPTLLMATNRNGRIIQWTAAAESRFGYAEAEALQQPLHLLFQPSDASGFYGETLAKAVAAGQVEWTFFGRGGFVVRCSARCTLESWAGRRWLFGNRERRWASWHRLLLRQLSRSGYRYDLLGG
jgi:PAS domain S-box-containing protein